MPKEYRNILVTCMVNLGDVVLASSCAQLLKEYYPLAKVTYMVKKSVAPVLENHPYIDKVITPEYQSKKKSLKQMVAVISDVKRQRFDLCIALDRKSRPAIIGLLAGISTRVIGDRLFDVKSSFITKLYTHVIKTPDDFRTTHQAAIFQSVVNGFVGRKHDFVKPIIGPASMDNLNHARTLFAQLPNAQQKLVLCIRGTYALKNWPVDQFAAVVNKLVKQHDVAFLLIGMPEDRAAGQELIGMLERPMAVHNICGETSLQELMAILASADGLLTVDTGAMHIAAAAGIPVVGIFRCISAQRWRPLCDRCEVVSIQLSECPQSGPPEVCPEKACLDKLPVESVMCAAEKLFWNK